MPVERAPGGTSLIDVLDRVLDKGIVIDAWVRVSLVGIDLITVEARIVVASIDTYLKYSEAVGQVAPVSKPAIEGRGYEEVIAENAALRAQLQSCCLRPPPCSSARADVGRRLNAATARRTPASRACASRSKVRLGRKRISSPHASGCSRVSSAAPRLPTARSTRCSGWPTSSACAQSICLVRPLGEQSLFVVGAHGVRAAGLGKFSVSVDDWANPLVIALTNRKQTFFPEPHSAADRRRRPSTPFDDAPFHVLPLGSGDCGRSRSACC